MSNKGREVQKMISYEKIVNGVLNFGKKIKDIWMRFWNKILTGIRSVANKFMTKFNEKVEGIALAMKRVDGSFKRVNSLYTKSGDGYKRTDIMTSVDEVDVPDELKALQNGDVHDITNEFEDVLVLEY